MKPKNIQIEFDPVCLKCGTEHAPIFWSPVDYYETGFPTCRECNAELLMKEDVHLTFTPEEVVERRKQLGAFDLVADRPTVQEAYNYAINMANGMCKTDKAHAGIAVQVIINTYARLIAEGKLLP